MVQIDLLSISFFIPQILFILSKITLLSILSAFNCFQFPLQSLVYRLQSIFSHLSIRDFRVFRSCNA